MQRLEKYCTNHLILGITDFCTLNQQYVLGTLLIRIPLILGKQARKQRLRSTTCRTVHVLCFRTLITCRISHSYHPFPCSHAHKLSLLCMTDESSYCIPHCPLSPFQHHRPYHSYDKKKSLIPRTSSPKLLQLRGHKLR
jgi:hypothetical protein